MRKITVIKNRNEIIGEMLQKMHESTCEQKKLIEQLIELHQLLSEQEEDENQKEDRTLVKGVGGLADYLGCGKNKAQDILNTGVLQKKEIAYRTGNRWIVNTTLLDEALAENPELLHQTEQVEIMK